MPGNHLREPLDYLYEELPPEKMAEVRQHLADCPECRAQMRAIRETVKLYRKAKHPIPPAGLTAATIKNALKIARARTDTQTGITRQQPDSPSSPIAPSPVVASPDSAPLLPEAAPAETASWPEQRGDAEFARLKEEVLGEINGGKWRSWFFHPAWTVAASVIFLCAVFIHFSPRMHRQEVSGFVSIPAQGATAYQLRERERLPASQPAPVRDAVSAEGSPILHEAALMNQLPDFSLSEERIADTPPDLPASAPEARPPSSRRSHRGPLRAKFSSKLADPTTFTSPSPELLDMPSPPPLPKLRGNESGVSNAAPQNAQPRNAPEPPKPFCAPSPNQPNPEHGEGAQKPGYAGEKQPDAEEYGGGRDVKVMMVDGFSPDDVPQIIERPTPIDVAERVRTLSALIGMQIACGELNDAREALAILEQYDVKAAAEMRVLLLNAPEQPETGKPKVRIGARLPVDAPAPLDKPIPTLEPVPEPPPVHPGLLPATPSARMPEAPGDNAETQSRNMPDAPAATFWTPSETSAELEPLDLDAQLRSVSRPSSAAPAVETPEPSLPTADPLSESLLRRIESPGEAQYAEEDNAAVVSETLTELFEVEDEEEYSGGEEGSMPERRTELQYVMEVETIVPVASDAVKGRPVSGGGEADFARDVAEYFSRETTERADDDSVLHEDVAPDPDPESGSPRSASQEESPATPERDIPDTGLVREIAVPEIMEPAAPPRGFAPIRTGPDQTTWIAIDASPHAPAIVERGGNFVRGKPDGGE